MPDFFDRLIARGTPGGEAPAVTLALPRLPGPFERPAAEPPDPFTEAIDEAAGGPGTPRARPALGVLAGTRAAITPPPRPRDGAISRAPGGAPAVPGEQRPARPAAPQQPSAAQARLAADAGAGATDRASGPARREAAGRDLRRDTSDGAVGRGKERLTAQLSPPGMLVVPASAVRAARPADEARTVQAQPPAPLSPLSPLLPALPAPPVVVRIGRIEVRNTSPERRERQVKRRAGAARAAPKSTLAAYLAAASAGSTGGTR